MSFNIGRWLEALSTKIIVQGNMLKYSPKN